MWLKNSSGGDLQRLDDDVLARREGNAVAVAAPGECVAEQNVTLTLWKKEVTGRDAKTQKCRSHWQGKGGKLRSEHASAAPHAHTAVSSTGQQQVALRLVQLPVGGWVFQRPGARE